MSFDAGSSIAHLDLEPGDFDRKLRERQAAADRFERDPIQVRLTQVGDQQSMSRARKMFADLDSQISRDAVNRMRSSPTGSVLGSLMALTSPRQIAGLPTGRQAARQGILGAVQQAPGTVTVSQPRDAAGRFISTATGGGGGGLLSHLRVSLGGGGGGGGTSGGGGGNQGWGTGLLKGIGPGILGLGLRSSLITGGAGIAGALLPALAGVGGAGAIAGIGAGFLQLGASQLIGKKNVAGKPPTQGPLFEQAQQASAALKDALKSAAQPLLAPLKSAFNQIPGLLRGITPALRQAFAGAGTLVNPLLHGLFDLARTILPLLGQAFRAVAPLIRPLIGGLGHLVSGVLKGLIPLLRASAPAVRAFSGVLATLGSGIGQMLKEFAPAVKASAVVLSAVGDVLSGLFPIIGKLAGVFARTLAPIFVVFAGVLRSLEPVLLIIGKVFASLAGAILKDLVAAFGALARLLKDIQPAIQIFAKALSQAFDVLENSGVFAVLGDALEAIVPSLAKLINLIAAQLAPILPVIITLVSQFATIMIQLLAAGLTTVLTLVTAMLRRFPQLVPILGAAAAAWWLFNIALDANPIGAVILGIVALVGGITLLVKHWGTVWKFIKSVAQDAWNFVWKGFGKYLLPLLGPVGLIALGAIELAKHWKTVTGLIKTAAHDLWQWLWADFGSKILNFFTRTIPSWWNSFIGFTKRDLWQPLKNGFTDLVNWVHDHVTQPILNTFTRTIPGIFRTAVSAIGRAWGDIRNTVRGPVAWVVDHVINGLISAFDWISGKVGGPHIPSVHPFGLRAGGRIPGYGGGDQHPALLESGEVVVPKEKAGPLGWLWKMIGIPGFQGGGSPGRTGNPHLPHGQPNPGGGIGGFISGLGHGILTGGKILAALATGNATALANALNSGFPHGTGGAIGDLAKVLADIPKTLVKDAVHSLISSFAAPFGGALGKGGLGRASLRQIEDWWMGAGGPGGIYAHIAAAITGAESGFNPRIVQAGQPYATTGWGLWQITPGNSEPQAGINAALLTGPTNAIAAVAKFQQAGNSFTPWTTYISGAYRAFMDHGGWLKQGRTLVDNRTGQPEAVLRPAQSQALLTLAEVARLSMQQPGQAGTSGLEHKLDRVIRAIERSAALTGAAVGDVINGTARSAAYRATYSARG